MKGQEFVELLLVHFKCVGFEPASFNIINWIIKYKIMSQSRHNLTGLRPIQPRVNLKHTRYIIYSQKIKNKKKAYR